MRFLDLSLLCPFIPLLTQASGLKVFPASLSLGIDPDKFNQLGSRRSARMTQPRATSIGRKNLNASVKAMSRQCWRLRQMASMTGWHLSAWDLPHTSRDGTEATVSIVPKGICLLGHSALGLYVVKRRRVPQMG